jgi:hypothetical protein
LLVTLGLCAGLGLGYADSATAASAVAFDYSGRHVYTYWYGASTKSEASRKALQSCQKRKGKRCRIVTSCSSGGYGAVYLRRNVNGYIRAFAASCGYQDARGAFSRASRECRKSGIQCAGPKSSWRDTR